MDYLKLNFPNKSIFDKHLKNLFELVNELNEEVTPPILTDEFNKTTKKWYRLNKSYFDEEFGDYDQASREYLKHLYYATDLTVNMRIEVQALKTIANPHFC